MLFGRSEHSLYRPAKRFPFSLLFSTERIFSGEGIHGIYRTGIGYHHGITIPSHCLTLLASHSDQS